MSYYATPLPVSPGDAFELDSREKDGVAFSAFAGKYMYIKSLKIRQRSGPADYKVRIVTPYCIARVATGAVGCARTRA